MTEKEEYRIATVIVSAILIVILAIIISVSYGANRRRNLIASSNDPIAVACAFSIYSSSNGAMFSQCLTIISSK